MHQSITKHFLLHWQCARLARLKLVFVLYFVNHILFDVNATLDVDKRAAKGMNLVFQGGGFEGLAAQGD